MNIIETELPGVVIIEPRVVGDARGLDMKFVQDNHSKSAQGTLRGLHYQLQQTQGKLVRVIAGEVFDVAVDIRRSSHTFGKCGGCYVVVRE